MMEEWKNWEGGKMSERRNINRGYMKLIVWQDAKTYYAILENGLKRLIESLQEKQEAGSWQDSFVVRESNEAYASEAT